MKKIILLNLVGFLLLFFSPLTGAEVVYNAHTQAELISENKSIRPGRPFWVAVRLKTDPHWHTYWQNPGDSGLPTKIKWQLPEGFSAGPIVWPYPQRIETAGLVVYGYENEILLLTQIQPPVKIDTSAVTLKARVDWLACEVPCIPGKAEFTLDLPVVAESEEATVDQGHQSIFADAFMRVPVKADNWKFEASEDADNIKIKFLFTNSLEKNSSIQFFPVDSSLIEHTAEQPFVRLDGKASLLTIQKNKRGAAGLHKMLQGVAVLSASDGAVIKALEVDTPFIADNASVPAVPAAAAGSLGLMLVFAFFGGMILNLMPCVFPVLSIKILTFVKHSQNKKVLLRSALAYAAGIVATFTALAVALIILREGGEQIGWGFQFQSPFFVVGMAFFLLVIALNLFGLFEWNIPFFVSTHKMSAGTEGREAFFSGVLAVIVATPCTAPFMGTAMSFALTQPKLINLLIFVFLGLGLAFPFVLMCLSPGLLKFLPKPGAWMDDFKKFLAFPVLATVVWLLWVLAGQKDTMTVMIVLMGFLIFTFGLWLNVTLSSKKTFSVLRVFSIACMITGVLWPLAQIRSGNNSPDGGSVENIQGIQWLGFNDRLIRDIPEGKIVFVDFTARWCLTCQVNERLTLSRPDVTARFKELGVITVKADWTNHDEAISKALAEFGKNSVPVYVILYSSGGQRQVKVLPELITPKIVLEAINNLK